MKRSPVSRICKCRSLQTVVFAAFFLSLAGCAGGKPMIINDIRQSGREAYQQWAARRKQKKEMEPHIKGKLHLDDAIKLALSYNKSLQAVVMEKEKARGRILEGYSLASPQVTLTGSYMKLADTPYFEQGPTKFEMGVVDNYSVELQVRQPVFRGGATGAAINAARLYSVLKDQTVRSAVQDTIFLVTKSYYDVQLLQSLVDVNEDAVRSAETHLNQVKLNHEQGITTDFDLLRAKVAVSIHRAELIRQKNKLHLAKSNLLNVIGVSSDSQVTPAGQLEYKPMKPVFDEAVRVAYENSPELLQAELGARLQKEAVSAVKSQYWPMLDAVFSQKWADPDPLSSTKDEWGQTHSFGAVLTWSLFDGMGRESRLIQQKAALRQRRIQLLDAREKVRLKLEQAILSIHDSEQFVESQKMNLELAARGLELAELGYKEGINTEIEVIDAQTALTMSQTLHYQAVYAHCMAKLGLYRAMGVLEPNSELSRVFGATATAPIKQNVNGQLNRETDKAILGEPK